MLLGHLSRKVGWADLQVIRVVIVLLIFGPGRLPEMMGHLGKGLQEFKKGLREPPEIQPQRLVMASHPTKAQDRPPI